MKPVTDMTGDNRENAHRMAGLLALCPWLTEGAGKSCLYVGAMPTRQDMLAELIGWGWRVSILEVWAPYLETLRSIDGVHRVYIGDVRHRHEMNFNLCFWWHGPEHMPASDTAIALSQLEAMSSQAVIVGMPYGNTGSGATEGNDNNRHQSAWYGPDIGALGYQWAITDQGHRNITAVKIIGAKP